MGINAFAMYASKRLKYKCVARERQLGLSPLMQLITVIALFGCEYNALRERLLTGR